jgi:hypothetical protein
MSETIPPFFDPFAGDESDLPLQAPDLAALAELDAWYEARARELAEEDENEPEPDVWGPDPEPRKGGAR